MSNLNDIFDFAKKLAASILKGEGTSNLNNAPHLSDADKSDLLKRLNDPDVKKNQQELMNQIDLEEGWSIVKTKIDKPVKKIGVWKYAIAASILILVTLPLLLKKDQQQQFNKETVQESIHTGTDKATLTLSSGEEISLTKSTVYKSTIAQSNGTELIYNATDSILNSPVVAYNYLTIPRGGQFFIKLNDGTKIWLNSETKLKYPVHFIENQPRQVELVYGEAYFEVSPSALHNGATFNVLNGMQSIEVLGTEFNIKNYADEDVSYITLAGGKIAWTHDKQQQTLAPKDQLIFEKNTNKLTRKKVNVYNEISWKDGILSFKEMTLKDIAIVLSRWYDVDFEFDKPELEKVRFNGVLSKKQSLENMLNTIEKTKLISAYEINNKIILLK